MRESDNCPRTFETHFSCLNSGRARAVLCMLGRPLLRESNARLGLRTHYLRSTFVSKFPVVALRRPRLSSAVNRLSNKERAHVDVADAISA